MPCTEGKADVSIRLRRASIFHCPRLYPGDMAQKPENPMLKNLRAIRHLGRIDDRWTALENDPRFLQRIERARKSLRAGRGVRLEDI